jgi:TolB-like protein/Tfp pilus assembly protein PilF
VTKLFAELKRRNVFRVGIAYLITAWLIAQVLELVLDSFGSPAWVIKTVLVVLAAGLPLVLVFSWVFELTPEGIKRDSEVDHSQSVTRQTGRKLDRAIIVVLLLALAYFVWESRFAGDAAQVAPADPATTANASDRGQAKPAAETSQSTAAEAAGQSVAVLPFVNMSPNPEQEYFSDGITEEVINALVKIPGLSVPARTSVFAYKGRLQDVREIGRELNVAHVLEGSIRSQGKQVRNMAQLINVDSGYHLWSETFDRQLENIFAVQEEIAGAIADVLVGELGVEVAAVPNQTRNMEAYDLYLQGRAALRVRDESAIDLFKAVTEKDPDFAPGWAALAIAHNSIDDDDQLAMAAAERALTLDPQNVDALNAKAAALRGMLRWREAGVTFDRALAIDPSSAELLEDYAEFLNLVGRSDEALQVTSRGIAIEPGLLPLTMAHVESLLTAGRHTEARNLGLEILDGPYGYWIWWALLPVWLEPGPGGALLNLPARPELPADSPSRFLAFNAVVDPKELSRKAPGLTERIMQLLDAESAYSGAAAALPGGIRAVLVHLGEIDFVIEDDIARVGQIVLGLPEWAWAPIFRPLRQHPRFSDYLERAGLVEYWDATAWPKWCQRDAKGVITCH